MNNTAIIIVAAGNSSRLGRPKQLLPYRNKTLLRHTVQEALWANPMQVIVVTGAYEEQVMKEIIHEPIQIIHNPNWALGMGSSIKAGLQKNLSLPSVIITVCDQPFVTASIFQQLYNEQVHAQKNIVACAYANTYGTPVLFMAALFSHLLKLDDNAGAKKMLQRFPEQLATIDFPKGSIDIDTEYDYDLLLNT